LIENSKINPNYSTMKDNSMEFYTKTNSLINENINDLYQGYSLNPQKAQKQLVFLNNKF
jgi:hypothetical protein